MTQATLRPIRWTTSHRNPVISPGQLNAALDARHAGAAHVLRVGDRCHLYYWGIGSDGLRRICRAEASADQPGEWRGTGSVLDPQPHTEYNHGGPSFPFVVRRKAAPWLMYFGAWGRPREDGKLANRTGLAVSRDAGATWNYHSQSPILPLDRPWDCEGTGSVCVVRVEDEYRMYYTALGEYRPKPPGTRTAHGDVTPWIGIGYAVSQDGVHWTKPLDELLIPPRGLDTEPYEYICSKPFLMHEAGGWRMWVSTIGVAYRIRSLTSVDGLNWHWTPSPPDGELGIGRPGSFDDHQRSYASVLRNGEEYIMWYTGNGYGRTGMGVATGAAVARTGADNG